MAVRRVIMTSMFASLLVLMLSAGPPVAQDIRRVDFQNFTYRPWCAPQSVTTKDGTFERDRGGHKLSFRVARVSYGDVNGDGRDEALVLTLCSTGGTGTFSDAFIYGMDGGKPKLLTTESGGDRADGGFHDMFVDRDGIVLDVYVNEGGGACCPTAIDRFAARIVRGKFQRGEPIRRIAVIDDDAAAAAPPIAFAPGASSTTVESATLSGVTYRLTARQGQTMTLRLDSRKDPTLSILDPGGNVLGSAATGGEWRGVLPASGVYRVRVESHQYVSLFRLSVEIR